MSSLADILNSSRSALRVQQLAMQVIGQNMANVGTDGYARRRLDLTTALPSTLGGIWNGGSGVDIMQLSRVRDTLIDDQIRRAGGGLGYWAQRDDALGAVEDIFSELGDNGISDRLSAFWGAWSDLANNPEGTSARLALTEKTQALAAGIRGAYNALEERKQTASTQITQRIDEVNALTAQIAQLNVQIVHVESGVAEASDLRDARDQALSRLSQIMSINTRENADGSVGVYADGQVLVQLDRNIKLAQATTVVRGRSVSTISAESGGHALKFEGGEIKALLEVRDQEIPATMEDLDNFAVALASRINALHRTGYSLSGTTSQDFFASDVSGAANFCLADAIVADPSLIAAGTTAGAPGDNSLALAIAGVQHEKILSGGFSTADDFLRDSVLRVGSRKSYAADQLAVEQGAMDALQSRRQNISGVSLDEEMTRLVQVQQAYNAAARIVTVVDEMMQTVIALGSAS
jgi:flagellar hook-associated protein 1